MAQNLIVTAVTASSVMGTTSVRAGQSSRPQHHRVDTGEPSGGQQVSRSRVACLNWWAVPFESEWDIFTVAVRRKEKSIITRGFFYILQGWVAVSLLQASSTLDFPQWYVFTLTPISNVRLLWKKNLLSMDTSIWSLCSGTDVFTSGVKNSQTSYHFGHPCWNWCQKCSRFCH